MENESIASQYSEKLVPLSADETRGLIKIRSQASFGLIILPVVVYLVIYFMMGQKIDTLFIIVVSGFELIVVSGLIYTIFRAMRNINFGQKKIVCGQINKKKIITTHSGKPGRSGASNSGLEYYFLIGKQEIQIKEDEYRSFQEGDFIEIEIMPKTSEILKLSKLHTNNLSLNHEKAILANNPLDSETDLPSNHPIFSTSDLDWEDKKLLKKRRNNKISMTLVVSTILSLSLTIACIEFTPIEDMAIISNQSSNIQLSIFWLVVLVMDICFMLLSFKNRSPYLLDLRNGKKNIIQAIISDKQKDDYIHYLIIDAKQYEVPVQIFNKAQAGERIKLHFAPYSKTFLKLEQI